MSLEDKFMNAVIDMVAEIKDLKEQIIVRLDRHEKLFEKIDKRQAKTNLELGEMRLSFINLDKRVEETNQHLGKVETRLDDTNKKLDETNLRLGKVETRLDETNKKLDETNLRLGKVEHEQNETNKRLGKVEIAIDHLSKDIQKVVDHEKRISKLERLVLK
jgi:chromosome segregation ATPase